MWDRWEAERSKRIFHCQNSLIKETKSQMNVSCTLKCFCSQSIYLFSSAPRLLPCFSSVCQPFLLPPLQGLFHLSYLNSLWTPTANSVSHLIRHINSISPLIAVIPLCSEFLLASLQGGGVFFVFFSFYTLAWARKKDLFERRLATQWQRIYREDNAQLLTHVLMRSFDPPAILDS